MCAAICHAENLYKRRREEIPSLSSGRYKAYPRLTRGRYGHVSVSANRHRLFNAADESVLFLFPMSFRHVFILTLLYMGISYYSSSPAFATIWGRRNGLGANDFTVPFGPVRYVHHFQPCAFNIGIRVFPLRLCRGAGACANLLSTRPSSLFLASP